MTKKILLPLLTLLVGSTLMAQVGVRIDDSTALDGQAQQAITTKLQQLATLNGVGSNSSEACFVLVPHVYVEQSEVTRTPPPQQLVKLSVVLMLMETANTESILAQTMLGNTGVGRSEAAAILNAIRQIDVRSPTLKRFMEQAKKKMEEIPPCKAVEKAAPAKEETAAEQPQPQEAPKTQETDNTDI